MEYKRAGQDNYLGHIATNCIIPIKDTFFQGEPTVSHLRH